MNFGNNLYIYLAVLFAGILLGAYLINIINKFFRTKGYQDRAEFAQFSEEEAEKLLKKSGYKILARHPKATVITKVDGRDAVGYVMCDYLAKKAGRVFVCEVKSGQIGTDPTEPSTRRQLLEYDYVYQPHGLLLVNMLDQKIHEVDFCIPKAGSDNFVLRLAMGAIVAIFIIVVIWMFMQIKI